MFKELLPLRPNLIQAIQEVSEESDKVEDARRNVGQLLLRYNDFVRPFLYPARLSLPDPKAAETDSKGFFKKKDVYGIGIIH